MNFLDSIKSGFRNYATFSGRAARSEFWWWWLFQVLVQLVFSSIDSNLGNVANVVLFVPSLAVSVRRVHDTNKSGWWVAWPWISLGVFFVAGLALLIDLGIDIANSVAWSSSDSLDGASGFVLFALVLAGLSMLVAFLVNLVFFLQKSDPTLNRFGPPPPPRV